MKLFNCKNLFITLVNKYRKSCFLYSSLRAIFRWRGNLLNIRHLITVIINNNLKKYFTCFILFLILFSYNILYAEVTSKAATIDIPLAISLHPKMALFDFERIGFYKLDYGINSQEEFIESAKKLKDKPRDNKKQIEALQLELDKLMKEFDEIEQKYAKDDDFYSYTESKKKNYFKRKELEENIKTLEWESRNSDITTREETKAIMAEIRKDINEAVKEVAREEKYSWVFNTSVVVPYKYDLKYVDLIYSQGIPDINFCLFYAFFLYSELINPLKKELESSENERWLELTKDANNLLPIINYPVVLSGGKSITSKVLKKIYDKNKIDKSLYEIIDTQVSRIESIRQGKTVEKLVIVGDE